MFDKGNGVKTYYKALGLCSFGMGANSSEVDVKDGRIIRIRPMRYDRRYKPEEMNPWQIKAHGKVFEPTMKSLLPPFSMIYKKRAYSPNRIPFPMKRVDWDPDGERNTQNRGKSKFVRISWDEATDIIAKEIKRQYALYGKYSIPGAVRRTRRDQVRTRSPRLPDKAAGPSGRLHHAGEKHGQLGRLELGRQTYVGHAAGRTDHAAKPVQGCFRKHENAPFLGLRPGDHHLGLGRPDGEQDVLLVYRFGHQVGIYLP